MQSGIYNFNSPENIQKLIKAIKAMDCGDISIMEVCGTHTMSIAKSGLKDILPPNIRLVSGPGCPVCVTPQGSINSILRLSENKDVVIASYGDMIRIPGSVYGDSLMKRRAQGADVRIVYSPMDAVEMAIKDPSKEFVFLAAGFETTAPGTAVAVEYAKEMKIDNFSIFSLLKRVEPCLRKLFSMEDVEIDGLLCPGHVAVIIGEEGLKFLPKDYGIPSVICGFEPLDILYSIYLILRQIKLGCSKLENEYTRAVRKEGNPAAMECMNRVFKWRDDSWRGMGTIKNSGLVLRDSYNMYDAEKKFNIVNEDIQDNDGCLCGEIIKGVKQPYDCPCFGKMCVPDNPIGPCMVSSEGTCAAYYKYQKI